ncbi:MAG: hypothetical protein ACK4Y5_00720 [Acetobacteraceae bacterium]|jgi:hypothetical protein
MFLDYWLPLLLNWLVATTILFFSTARFRLRNYGTRMPTSPLDITLTVVVLLLYLTLCFVPLAQYPPDFWVWLLH